MHSLPFNVSATFLAMHVPVAVFAMSIGHADALDHWHGIRVKPVEGQWQGKPERAYVVRAEDLPTIESGGWLNGEKTVLLLEPARPNKVRPAWMLSLTPGTLGLYEIRPFGLWREEFDPRKAQARDHTYDRAAGAYFVVDEFAPGEEPQSYMAPTVHEVVAQWLERAPVPITA